MTHRSHALQEHVITETNLVQTDRYCINTIFMNTFQYIREHLCPASVLEWMLTEEACFRVCEGQWFSDSEWLQVEAAGVVVFWYRSLTCAYLF